jgi:hypothetical protein
MESKKETKEKGDHHGQQIIGNAEQTKSQRGQNEMSDAIVLDNVHGGQKPKDNEDTGYRYQPLQSISTNGDITYTPYPKIENTAIFEFKKEWPSHVAAEALLQNPQVIFPSSSVDLNVAPGGHMKIQTNGQITPAQALIQVLKQLEADVERIEQEAAKLAKSTRIPSDFTATTS